MADQNPTLANELLDDDTLAFLALAEPVIKRARHAPGNRVEALEDVYFLARSALAFLLDDDSEIAKTRAVNSLGLALAGLEGHINSDRG
jgi:hypothetical protein